MIYSELSLLDVETMRKNKEKHPPDMGNTVVTVEEIVSDLEYLLINLYAARVDVTAQDTVRLDFGGTQKFSVTVQAISE